MADDTKADFVILLALTDGILSPKPIDGKEIIICGGESLGTSRTSSTVCKVRKFG